MGYDMETELLHAPIATYRGLGFRVLKFKILEDYQEYACGFIV